MFGWFGGYGLSGTLNFFTETMGVPLIFALLVVGFLTRIAAFGVACVMAEATFMVHLPNRFIMNWSGQQAGEGFEFHLLAIALALALLITGGGKASLDGYLSRNKD